MDAVALICIILFLIGAALALYYAVLCLQAAPLPNKRPSHPDMGPLLQEDLNANHEEGHVRPAVAIDQPDSTAKKGSDADDEELLYDSQKEGGIEPPLKSLAFQATPECAAKSPNEGSVVLPIDDELSVLNSSKPLIPPHETTLGKLLVPTKPPQEVNPTAERPLNPMSLTYDEDGLLISGTAPRPHVVSNMHPGMYQTMPQGISQGIQQGTPLIMQQGISQGMQQGIPYNTRMPQPKVPLKHVQFSPFVPPSIINSGSQFSQPQNDFRQMQCSPSPPHSVYGKIEGQPTNVFVFGAKHKSEETPSSPTKRAKVLPLDDAEPKVEEMVTPSAPPQSVPNTPVAIYSEPEFYSTNIERKETSGPQVEANTAAPLENDENVTDSKTEPTLNKAEEPPAQPHYGWKPPSAEIETTPEERDLADRAESQPSEVITVVKDVDNLDTATRNISFNQQQPDQPTELVSDIEPEMPDHTHENAEATVEEAEDKTVITRVRVTFPAENEEKEGPESSSNDCREESASESSDPDITEYSFQSPHAPSTAIVLANEVSCYSGEQIGLTNYIFLPESTAPHGFVSPPCLSQNDPPLTPTSDITQTPSPTDITLDDETLHHSTLGTPPVTPPDAETPPPKGGKAPPPYVKNINDSTDTVPTYIVLEQHQSRERLSSTSSHESTVSSSSLESSSASDGSYKIVLAGPTK